MEEKLTHFDEKGNAIMVDVTDKKITPDPDVPHTSHHEMQRGF